MDVHKAAEQTIYVKAEVFLSNYCYSGDWEKEKYLYFDVKKEDWPKIKGKTFEGREFEFTVDGKEDTTYNGEEGKVQIKVFYKALNIDSLSEDITEDGVKKYGVINPEGKFFRCGYAGHNDLEYWLKQRGLFPSNEKDPLEYFGWVKLTGSYMSECEFCFQETVDEYDFDKGESVVITTNKLTQAQVDTMVSYIESLGREFINFQFSWFGLEDFKGILKYDGDLIDFSMDKGDRHIEDGMEELHKEKRNEQ